jgi:N-acetyl-gamma-glutamyl-phosphate reductase
MNNKLEDEYKSAANNSPLGGGGFIRVGIIGGAGYTGGELIRLLINHPCATIAFVHSNSNAGNAISKVHADLIGETDLQFSGNEALAAESLLDTDVLFLCTGHGEAKKFLEANAIPAHIKIIDLSNDFRLAKHAEFHQPTSSHHTFIRNFIYGLPELNKEAIRAAHNIANPGCFATAIQLGLLPLAKAGLLNDIYTTGITGSTGAGQGLSTTSHFSWRANNIQAYKTLNHQHMSEIVQSLSQLQSGFLSNTSGDDGLSFVPWRGDFTRGIFISSTLHCEQPIEQLTELYKDFYATHPFTFVSNEPIFLKQVVNTNKCIIQLEKVGSKLVVHSILDNLLKGASGQAVQNMNLMFGLEEEAGLRLKASAF